MGSISRSTCKTETVPINNGSPFLLSAASDSHDPVVSVNLCLLGASKSCEQCLFPWWLAHFTLQTSSGFLHVVSCVHVLPFHRKEIAHPWIVLHGAHMSHFLYPFVCLMVDIWVASPSGLLWLNAARRTACFGFFGALCQKRRLVDPTVILVLTVRVTFHGGCSSSHSCQGCTRRSSACSSLWTLCRFTLLSTVAILTGVGSHLIVVLIRSSVMVSGVDILNVISFLEKWVLKSFAQYLFVRTSCTKGFCCDMSIHACNMLWPHSPFSYAFLFPLFSPPTVFSDFPPSAFIHASQVLQSFSHNHLPSPCPLSSPFPLVPYPKQSSFTVMCFCFFSCIFSIFF